MQSDFTTRARLARATLPVPDYPADRIRSRARAATVRSRARLFAVAGGLVLAAVGMQTGFAAKLTDGVRVWLSGSKAAVAVESFAMVGYPTATQVRAAVAHATFPVTLPVGLPADARIQRIAYSPADRPSFIMIQYSGRNGFNAGFSIVDTSAVATGTPSLPGAGTPPAFQPVDRWTAGAETVLVPSLDSARRARIEAAMRGTTPAQSITANEALGWQVIVLGGRPDDALRAERLVSPGAHAVLLDRGHLRWITDLLKHERPMPDGRAVELTHIPNVNGEPDYAHATLRFTHAVAVPIVGMRAIVAALSASHTSASCACEVLLEGPQANGYRVVTIPLAPAAGVTTADVALPGLAVRVLH